MSRDGESQVNQARVGCSGLTQRPEQIVLLWFLSDIQLPPNLIQDTVYSITVFEIGLYSKKSESVRLNYHARPSEKLIKCIGQGQLLRSQNSRHGNAVHFQGEIDVLCDSEYQSELRGAAQDKADHKGEP